MGAYFPMGGGGGGSGAVMHYKGSVLNMASLPTTATVGDVYNILEDGSNVAWDGTGWDAIGTVVKIDYATDAEIDAMLAEVGF